MNELSPEEIEDQINKAIDKLYSAKKLALMVEAWRHHAEDMQTKIKQMGFKYSADSGMDEFIKKRVATIGGSDVPILMRKSAFMTAVELYHQKTLHQSTLKIRKPSEPMLLGHDMEPGIVTAYKRVTGNVKIFHYGARSMERLPWMVGNIDGRIKPSDDILECKLAGTFSDASGENWGRPNEYAIEHDKIVQTIYSDIVPVPYLMQCMTYMLIYNAPQAQLAVFYGASKVNVYTIPFDIKIATDIIRKSTAFLFNNVIAQVHPKPVCIDDVNQIYCRDDGQSCFASSELKDLRIDAMAYKEDITALVIELGQNITVNVEKLKECTDSVTFKIKSIIEENQIVNDGNNEKILSWKNQNKSGFNMVLFRNEEPKMHAKYETTDEIRVLRYHKTIEEKKATKRSKK